MLVGIVGKPNCGKSTFFKAATLAEVEIANYPFVTIKPNHGIGYVKIQCVDKEFNVKCQPKFGYCINNNRFVPFDMLDVAGLVPGAHKGLGRGNEFLDDLRQADVLIHVIDVSGSTNEKGEPIAALSYDPAEDVKFLEVEIDEWFFSIIKKGWEKFARQIQQERKEIHKALANQLSGLKITEELTKKTIEELGFNKEKPTEWTDSQLKQLASELRKATKPMIIACNKIDIPGAENNVVRLQNEFPDYMLVACSSESELALKEAAKHNIIDYIPGESSFAIKDESKLNDKQKAALKFIKTNILEKFGSTGIQQVLNDAVFKLLDYIAAYPVAQKLADKDGNILPDCHLIPQKTTAQEFAYIVHTDLGKNFIRAIDIKTKQIIGKDHILKNGDVIEIVSSK